MGASKQLNSGPKSSSVWPEERLREELDHLSRPIERLVGELASAFGVRLLSERALRNIEGSLAAQQIAAVPTPLPLDPDARVSLYHDPDVQPPLIPAGVEAEGDPESAHDDEPRVPTAPWELTAPESYVLRYGKHGFAFEAFKLGVKELVARGALEVKPVEKRLLGWPRKKHVLCEGRRRYAITQPALLPALELYDATEKETFVQGPGGDEVVGVLIERFARAAAKKFRPGFAPYRDEVVMPLLAERELATILSNRSFFFTTKSFSRTPAGRAADDELEGWMVGGRERLRYLLDEDPSQALAYAGTAGPALLLMNDLTSPLAFLDQHLDGHGAYVASGGAAVPPEPGDGALDLGALGQLDLSAFNSFDAIGAGLAAGGGGGGGGCGGDGGGGGGC